MQQKRRNVSLRGLLQAAALLTVVLSFLTGLDIPHRNIELFSHFRLQYFVVSVVLFVVFAAMRRYTYAGALAATVMFNASFVLPWYFADVAVTDSPPLKFVLANVHSANNQYGRLIELIAAEKPDLIFLQEVTPEWVAGTRELLKEYPHTYAASRVGNFGVAAFSKIPFDSIGHVDSPPLGYPTINATITINDELLNIISSHPTHPLGREHYDARNEQMESIAELANQYSGKVVLLGDFNSSIWCAHFRKLEASTGLKNVRRGFGVLPSWPTFFPVAMIPIDHALVSEGVSVLDVRTGGHIGSDHLPLIVTLSP